MRAASHGGTSPHLRGDKTLDAAWYPNANDTVYALAVRGSTVYDGGRFSSIGGVRQSGFAAFVIDDAGRP